MKIGSGNYTNDMDSLIVAIFRTTSNGFASTGDGLNLAHRAGIPLMDMEFVQFHPPAALVRAFRYLFDSRDEGERIALLDNKDGAWGCQTKWM